MVAHAQHPVKDYRERPRQVQLELRWGGAQNHPKGKRPKGSCQCVTS